MKINLEALKAKTYGAVLEFILFYFGSPIDDRKEIITALDETIAKMKTDKGRQAATDIRNYLAENINLEVMK